MERESLFNLRTLLKPIITTFGIAATSDMSAPIYPLPSHHHHLSQSASGTPGSNNTSATSSLQSTPTSSPKASIDRTQQKNVNFFMANFEGAYLEDVRWEGCYLDGANFKHSIIRRSSFNYATTMFDTDLSGADLTNCVFDRTDISRIIIDPYTVTHGIYGYVNLCGQYMSAADGFFQLNEMKKSGGAKGGGEIAIAFNV